MQKMLLLIYIMIYSIKLVNSQFGYCDYEQIIESGKSLPIFSQNYPRPYPAGFLCRWTAKSDRPIQIKCDLRIPPSNQCRLDYLLIKSSSDAGRRYCGYQNLTVVSDYNELIASLYTASSSPGGSIFCTLQTVQVDSEDCKCGWKNPSRIVGGEDTGINEYPMMAALVDIQKASIHCGATIINTKQVLTAAHCLNNQKTNSLGVLVGEHDISNGTETHATKLFKVAKYVMHSRWTETESTDYDIGIVTIQGIIQFNAQVGPACLPFQHSLDSFAGNVVKLLGWGNQEFAGAMSNILQKVFVNIITNRNCKRTFKDVGPRQICHYRQGKDACQFDSGGPVLWHNPTTDRLLVIGIISYGTTCGDAVPAVNTRVGAFVDWILAQSPPGFQYCEAE